MSEQETKIEGFENVQEEDAGAYLNNYKAHKKGIGHEEMVQAYSEWAETYDKDLCPGRYNGPEIAANALEKLFPEAERSSIRVLDVAAGTGRVGFELHKKGFRLMDALEPSAGMLKVLMARGIYQESYETPIGFDRLNVPSNLYDALVIAGGMGEGHIPVQAVKEMIRMVKAGGMVVIVMREEYLSYVEEYVGKLEPYMDELEKEGKWKRVGRDIVPEYSFNKNGVVFSYQVLSSDD